MKEIKANQNKFRTFIAARLRDARKASGLTVKEVAKKVSRTPNAIYAWENSVSQPDADMFVQLCRLYGVDFDYFFPPLAGASRSLEPEEVGLIDIYRAISPEGKRALMTIAKAFHIEYAEKTPSAKGSVS